MKLNGFKNITFEKKHVANCAIIKNNKPVPCKIYKLEEGDEDYYCKKLKTSTWKNCLFSFGDCPRPKGYFIHRDHFVIEDEKERCISFCEVEPNATPFEAHLHAIETAPKYSSANGKRKAKYIGETLIAFLAMHYQKMNKNLYVENALGEAEDFYSKNCHMTKVREIIFSNYTLPKEAIEQLLLQNEAHTKTKIEYLA